MNTNSAQPTHLRLHSLKDEIISRWLTRAKQEVEATYYHSNLVIIDSLSEVIDTICSALDPKNASLYTSTNSKLSSEHGRQRALIGQYNVEQIILESDILQEIIINYLEYTGELKKEELKIIYDYFRTSIQQTISQFVKTMTRIQTEQDVQFKLLVQKVQDYAIFMLDVDGRIITWNEGAQRIKQYEAEEILGKHLRILYREEDQKIGKPEKNLNLALKQGYLQEQWWRRKKDGSLFWADVTITTVYNEANQHIGFSKVVRDLTARKMVEIELRKAKAAAESANNLKSKFLANMSHEIRTPLGAILGMTELLKETELPDLEKNRCFQVIERNSHVLSRLIEDILDLSKIEAGKLEINIVPHNIRDLLADIASLFEIQSLDKGVPVITDIHPAVPEYIQTDPVRFRQIITNLVGNAVKFTEKGEIRIEVRYDESSNSHPLLEVVVADTGPGIPKELQYKLFEPFSQVDSSLSRRFGGTGLGLILSRRLARELGGDVVILDCPTEVGCQFKITIENRKKEVVNINSDLQHQIGYGTKNTYDEEVSLKGKKILCAEDSMDNQFLIKKMLSRYGLDVDFAKDGQEAYEKAVHGNYDLILMDIQMPLLDGNESTRKIREMGWNKPILALTAHAMKEEREKSLAAGCNDYLTKPINKQLLIEKIKKLTTSAYTAG